MISLTISQPYSIISCDVIFLLPSPSVNTLQVSHIRRDVQGSSGGGEGMPRRQGEEIEKTEAAKSVRVGEGCCARPPLESHLSSLASTDLSIIRRICLLESSPRCVLRDGKSISFESDPNERKKTGKANGAMDTENPP